MIGKIDRKTLNELPSLVVSDEKGNLMDIPEYGMAGRSGPGFVIPQKESIIALPAGSDLLMLPDRHPAAVDRRTGRISILESYEGIKVFSASAFLPPAYTSLYLAAFKKTGIAKPLPLFAYTALGFKGDKFVVPAVRVDSDSRQDCSNFNQDEVIKRGKRLLKHFRNNRLTTHLIENCAFRYLCPAARNWVMGRWEAPVPVSRGCNAQCEGCISHQPEQSGTPATQERLSFTPSVGEVAEYAVPHLQKAERAIISFGQGCEGEPLTEAGLIREAVSEIRKKTSRGTINLNTNASLPHDIERICRAGLDSIRISLNSVQEEYYNAYSGPAGYKLADVFESVAVAKRLGVWVSINYFICPGFTDREDEMSELKKLLKLHDVDMIQMRNLNMDPDVYMGKLRIGRPALRCAGIRRWMKDIKAVKPGIRFGYFNPFLG